MHYTLEQVFNESTFPEVTFVEPKEKGAVLSALRAEGKHVTIIGPSGSGKSTLIDYLLKQLGVKTPDMLKLNGRQYSDINSIFEIFGKILTARPTYEEITPLLQLVKYVFIDDFHYLTLGARKQLTETLKLWHEHKSRFIIIGIAGSVEELLCTDDELGIRNEPFKLDRQDDDFTEKVLTLGENALNIAFSPRMKSELIRAANGVPSVIQIMGRAIGVHADITETVVGGRKDVEIPLSSIRHSVLRSFDARYLKKIAGLAQGKHRSKSVHNTYFDIVNAIKNEDRTEIPITFLFKKIVDPIKDPRQRAKKTTSFHNCLNYLSEVIEENGLSDVLYYPPKSSFISIEDPSFRFYLNLVDIETIKSKLHLRSDDFPWDVAVSFAGDIRPLVETFVAELKNRGLQVFYDFDVKDQLWGKDLRKKLGDVYSDEARYMVVFLSNSYPERDWTDFELAMGKRAQSKRTEEYLLPVVVDDVDVVGVRHTIGHVTMNAQNVSQIAEMLSEKIAKAVSAESAATP